MVEAVQSRSGSEPLLNGVIVPVTPFQQNCTILWDRDSKRGMVIDPGGDVPTILNVVEQHEVTVERILLTHGHLDHAGGASELASALRVKEQVLTVEGPDRRDQFLLDGIAAQAAKYGFDAAGVTPDRWLMDGDTVMLGKHRFDVLHCPGHTPGHIVFVNHAARFALLGDVLFRGSVGRTDFPYGNHQALVMAIRTKLLPLGDDFAFICGHGPASTIGHERQSNPFLR